MLKGSWRQLPSPPAQNGKWPACRSVDKAMTTVPVLQASSTQLFLKIHPPPPTTLPRIYSSHCVRSSIESHCSSCASFTSTIPQPQNLSFPTSFHPRCLSRTSTHSLKSTISRPSVSKLQDMRQLKARRSLADILYPSTNSKNDRPKASKPFSIL